MRRNALQLPVLWNTWRQRLSNWAWILHNTAGGPKKMLRNESLQARKSLSGTPPFRLRLLFVCLFVYDQLKWKIYFDQWILFKKRNDPQRWAAIREIGERKFEKKRLGKDLNLSTNIMDTIDLRGCPSQKKKRINALFEVWSLINYISWKWKLELLIFSNLYLNLNVNQSEKIMQRPFVLPGRLNQALGFNILFTEMRH